MARRNPGAPHVFRGHELDEFQIEAAIAIQQDMSTLVSAPTGTGKSLIADYLVDEMLQQGRRVIYTAPIKALVNQKYREFRELYGGMRTGILTGDLSLNPDAPLVVMTTEVLRNRLLVGDSGSDESDDRDGESNSTDDNGSDGDNSSAGRDGPIGDRRAGRYGPVGDRRAGQDRGPGKGGRTGQDGASQTGATGKGGRSGQDGARQTGAAGPGARTAQDVTIAADWVIFDEIHYIDHPQRGTVWEEAMLLLPPGCRLLGLSATVPNIKEIAAWLEAVYGDPVATIVHTERAVPLRHRYFTDAGRLVDYADMWQDLTGEDLKAGTVSVEEAASWTPPERPAGPAMERSAGPGTGRPAGRPSRQPSRQASGQTSGHATRTRRYPADTRRDHTHLELVGFMQRSGLFPAIYFVLSRREGERMAKDLARRRNFLRPHEREAVRVTVRHILQQAGLTPAAIPGFDAMTELWFRGVGVHHAGLLPIVKHIVEHLLERRILRKAYV